MGQPRGLPHPLFAPNTHAEMLKSTSFHVGEKLACTIALSKRLESLVAFLKCLIYMGYGLSPVPMEFFWSSLKLPLGILEVMDGRLYSRMMLRSRTCRGRVGSCRSDDSRLRRRRLCVKT